MSNLPPYQLRIRNRSVFVLPALVVAFIPMVFSQSGRELQFDRLSSENIQNNRGLSQNSVHCILQDSIGYMWFGTWDGLNKYNGYDFIVFTSNETGGQTIYTLLEGSNHDLWVGSDNGLTHIDRITGTLNTYHPAPDDPASLVHDAVTALAEDTAGNIWIGTQQGLCFYDRTTGTFTRFLNLPQDNTPLRSNSILDMEYDGGRILWIGTRMGLIRFDMETYITTRFYHEPGNPSTIPHNMVREVMMDERGFLWVGTHHGLCMVDVHKDTLLHFFHDPDDPTSLTDSRISALLKDNKGKIWIGTDNGLNLFGTESAGFKRFFNQSYNPYSISNNRILSLYEDRKGTLWIGTFNGVNKIDPYAGKFRHLRKVPDDPNSLNSNYVISIAEDARQTVWIATDNGLNLWDRTTGTFSHLVHQPKNPNSIASNNLRVVYFDRKGFCWIGTQNEGLDRYDPVTGRITHFENNPRDTTSLSSNDILCILEDSRGNLWIGTGQGGLNRMDIKRKKFTVFQANPSKQGSISSNQVWCLFEDRDYVLWAGTDNGLNRFDSERGTFHAYTHDPADTSSLGARQVFCIHQDADGVFWIGTKGGGLNRFDRETERFIHYTTQQGLPSNVVYGILEDRNEQLWFSTNGGLSRFDKTSGRCTNYDRKDGIQSNEFNLGAFFKNQKGELYFGGMNGLNLFHPSEINTNPVAPRTVITSFSVFDQAYPSEILNGDTIRLSENENFFTIGFSALDFTNPARNRYRYQLHNYDKGWSTVNAENRKASYTKVTPGHYLFTVMGSNNDGVWDQDGTRLHIIITPLWYHTWVFRSVCLALCFILIWYLISRRIRWIRRRHEVEKKMLDIEKQLYDTELQALRLQMNPHFIFNTLNSIQSFILENDTDRAVDYLGKFSQLIRLILVNSKEPMITVKEELKALRYYLDLEKLRFNDKFDYTIEIDPQVDEEFVEIPTMIIQPYVENAIIHGLLHKDGKGHLDLKIRPGGDHILWIIQDDGIGRERAMEIKKASGLHRKSRGMLITMERLEALNKKDKEQFSVEVFDLKDAAGNPTGTRVELRISGKQITINNYK